MNRRRLVTVLLVLGIVVLFVVPLALHAGSSDFAGTDSKATELIEESDPGYRPWFDSVFSPGSSEVESGLFALQAAFGGAVLGYVLGRLRSRRALREALAARESDTGAPQP
ncbi:energy-coupling factor ABC transporter substrate-binding protein [Modestobacter sp. NPDC049651]|uniref:energy-coupling factor ABC transporter substrate-binding protein n=1 Tax=unclassified Modestobacter TaxID=2643866 RepID=UPI0033DB4FBD